MQAGLVERWSSPVLLTVLQCEVCPANSLKCYLEMRGSSFLLSSEGEEYSLFVLGDEEFRRCPRSKEIYLQAL